MIDWNCGSTSAAAGKSFITMRLRQACSAGAVPDSHTGGEAAENISSRS
jgi:hypothetical protein